MARLFPRAVPEASRSAAFAAIGILVGIVALATAAGLAFFLRRRHRRALHRRRRAHRVTIDPLPTPTPFMRKAPPRPLNLGDHIDLDVPSSPTRRDNTNFKFAFPSSRPSTPGSGGLTRFLHGVHGSISSLGFGSSRDDEERVMDIVSRADTPVSARLPLVDFTTPSPRSAAFTLSRAPSAASTFGNISPVEVRVPLDLLDASPPRSAFMDMSAEERDLTMMSPLSPEAPQSAASTGTWISSVTSDRSPRTPFSAISSKFQHGYDGAGTFGSGTMMSTSSGKSTTTTSTSTTYASPTPYVPPRPPLHTATSFDSSITASSTKSSTSPPKRPRRRDTKDFLRTRDETDALLYAALKREARKNKKGKDSTKAGSSDDGENANPFLDATDRGRSLPPAYSPPHVDSPLRAMFSPIELTQARANLELTPSLYSSSSLRSTSSSSTRLPTRSSSLMVPGSSHGVASSSGSRGLVSHPSTYSLASSTYSHARSSSGRSTRSNGRPLPLPPGSF